MSHLIISTRGCAFIRTWKWNKMSADECFDQYKTLPLTSSINEFFSMMLQKSFSYLKKCIKLIGVKNFSSSASKWRQNKHKVWSERAGEQKSKWERKINEEKLITVNCRNLFRFLFLFSSLFISCFFVWFFFVCARDENRTEWYSEIWMNKCEWVVTIKSEMDNDKK